jgi:hypothetical protein
MPCQISAPTPWNAMIEFGLASDAALLFWSNTGWEHDDFNKDCAMNVIRRNLSATDKS